MNNSIEVSKVSGSKLLLDEYPLLVLPGLARAIGLNESIVIQQVHYWLQKSNHFYDGCYWIYNSYEKWQEQFPFWSERTLRTIISNLEKSGLLISGNYNRLSIDRTKWYTIAYDLLDNIPSDKIVRPSGRFCHMDRQNPSDHLADSATPIPETTDHETNDQEITEREEERGPGLSLSSFVSSSGECLEGKSSEKEKDPNDKTSFSLPGKNGNGDQKDTRDNSPDLAGGDEDDEDDEEEKRPEIVKATARQIAFAKSLCRENGIEFEKILHPDNPVEIFIDFISSHKTKK